MKPRAGNGPSMFLRMLVRASVVRRGRASAALVAVVVAAATATTMLNLYTDVGAKLHREFRSYGANIVVAGRDSQALPPGTLATIDRTLAGRGIAVPFAYAVARRSDGNSIIAAGTDFAKVQRLNRWWNRVAGIEVAIRRMEAAEDRHEARYRAQSERALAGDPDAQEFLREAALEEKAHARVLNTMAAPPAGPRAALDTILKRERWHGRGGSWVADAIYGVNDGLGAVFGIVSGVAGATNNQQHIILVP